MSLDAVESMADDSSQYQTRYEGPILDADDASSHVPDEGNWHHAIDVEWALSSRTQKSDHTQNVIYHLCSKPDVASREWYGQKGEIEPSSFPDLRAALEDVNTIENEALEEDLPVPSLLAHTNTRKLLPRLYAIEPCRFEVYPTPDGEIAIDARWRARSSILLLCDSQGGALCLVNNRGNQRRASYSSVDTLPDGFIREAMIELAYSD